MRLQKAIAAAGFCSRRKAEELIQAGRVKVNGEVVSEMGVQVSDEDLIEVENQSLRRHQPKEYWVFYKPRGVLSTVRDDRGRPTVMDYYKGSGRIYPVGRLDYQSEGLMLLTNDGEFAQRMMHPRYEKRKRYLVFTNRPLCPAEIEKLEAGVTIDDYHTRPIGIRSLKKGYEFTLYEGRNRQIRKMLETIGVRVESLKRIAMGGLNLGNMRPGEMRAIRKEEL